MLAKTPIAGHYNRAIAASIGTNKGPYSTMADAIARMCQ
jgi:hypothetical protein